jgi:D-alanine-D-alanine ligase
MSKIRLAVLFGGISGEHEVSCLSAASILANLAPSRYEITSVGISKEGRWYLQPAWSGGPLRVIVDPALEVVVRPGSGLAVGATPLVLDAVFPITHGIQGEDGKIQGLLECAQLPYAGAGVLASALGMDKAIAKQLWQSLGLPVVPSITLKAVDTEEPEARKAAYQLAVRTLGTPLFVKPANSGSSVGVAKVTSAAEFAPALEAAFAVDGKVLVETAVDAREIEVAVLGGVVLRAYGPGEVAPTHDFYDYDAKYVDPEGADLVIPARLDSEATSRILGLAVKACAALEVEGFARVDFFVSRKDGRIWLNEINTLPGFTTISMFPRMAVAGGLTYAQVLDAIVDQALETCQRGVR